MSIFGKVSGMDEAMDEARDEAISLMKHIIHIMCKGLIKLSGN